MNVPACPLFKKCDIRRLGSEDVVHLSRCWREDRVRMTHHIDGTADIGLHCQSADCACAQALSASFD